MKLYLAAAVAAAALMPLWAPAQTESLRESQAQEILEGQRSLFQEVTGLKTKTNALNIYMNMHNDFAADWTGSHFDQGKFQFRELRFELKGDINDWISYRWRQKLNHGDRPANFDNTSSNIDVMEVVLKLGKWKLHLGKQVADYGGMEYDLNPIEIYQYSDMLEYAYIFMTGVGASYDITPRQQLQLQVLDALTGPSEDMYGHIAPSKVPVVGSVNWNGNFNDRFITRWSASAMSEVKGKMLWYYALGNQLNITPTTNIYFDWMYSREGIDRTSILTSIVGQQNGHNALNTEYMSWVLHLNWRFAPKWNFFAKGMYEREGISKSSQFAPKGNYRTAYGWVTGVEFYPLNQDNLHFFVNYVGRHYAYSSLARTFGAENYNTTRLAAGFIWQMKLF